MIALDESRALRDLQTGSEEALAWFIDRYTAYVNTVVSNIIGRVMPAADVEEVDADVFVALWNHAEQLRESSVKGWLGSVARNMAKNRLRTLGRDLPLEDDAIFLPGDSPEDEAERREERRLVEQAVLNMNQPVRDIMLRHYYYGQTVTVIAGEMRMNPSTVKSHLSRGREKLRAVLAREL